MAPAQNSLRMSPSYRGVVLDTRDAIALFQAALHGRIPMITRRPHDKERPNTIISGNTFVYNEQTSSIKRWTDGVTWSPSRISGNYLLYREMESSFPPGEKKRAIKRGRAEFGDGYVEANEDTQLHLAPGDPMPERPEHYLDPYIKKCFVGSLIDSYHFKRGGLIKKTISIKVLEHTLHLVSYYTIEDIFLDRFPRPCQEFNFTPMPEIIAHTGWRVAIDANGEEDRSFPSPKASSPETHSHRSRSISPTPKPQNHSRSKGKTAKKTIGKKTIHDHEEHHYDQHLVHHPEHHSDSAVYYPHHPNHYQQIEYGYYNSPPLPDQPAQLTYSPSDSYTSSQTTHTSISYENTENYPNTDPSLVSYDTHSTSSTSHDQNALYTLSHSPPTERAPIARHDTPSFPSHDSEQTLYTSLAQFRFDFDAPRDTPRAPVYPNLSASLMHPPLHNLHTPRPSQPETNTNLFASTDPAAYASISTGLGAHQVSSMQVGGAMVEATILPAQREVRATNGLKEETGVRVFTGEMGGGQAGDSQLGTQGGKRARWT